jgi:hypothetical protein
VRIFILILVCSFALQPAVRAFNGGRCHVDCCKCLTDAEFRIAYFYPKSNLFRRIYKRARVDYGLEFTQHPRCHWDIWENVTWLPTSGHSIGEHRIKTNLDLLIVSAGVKYRICCDPCNIFHLGLGGVYYNLWIQEKSPWAVIEQHRHFHNGGLVVKADYEHRFSHRAYLGLFIDYYYLPINRTESMIRDVGGANFGALIGYRF